MNVVVIVVYFKYYRSIYLGELRKTMKHLSQDRCSVGRY
jgi:hypothetical protein